MMTRVVATLAGLALVAAVAQDAHATRARIDSMGGGVKSITIEDSVNVFEFPSLLVRYGNLTYIDNINSGFANTFFGFHYALNDDMVLAIYGGRVNAGTRGTGSGFDAAGNSFTGASSLGIGSQASLASQVGGGPAGVQMHNGDALTNVDLKMGILYALRLGTSARLGFMLNILGDDADIEQPNGTKVDQGSFLIDFAASFGVDLESLEIEAGLGLEIGGLDDLRDGPNRPLTNLNTGEVPNGSLVENWTANSHFGLRLGGRMTVDFFDLSKLVPYLKLSFGSQEVAQSNLPLGQGQTGTWSAVDFLLGADLRFEPFENVIVAPGLGIRYAQQSLEGTQTQGGVATSVVDRDVDRLISLPYYGIGVDVKVFEWMDFRFGANQSVDFDRRSTTAGGVTNERRFSSVRTDIATGFGINLPVAESTLSLDVNVNPMFWINGPDFISGGANSTANFGVNGAISYDW